MSSLRSWFRGPPAVPSATNARTSTDPSPAATPSASTSTTGLFGPAGYSPALSTSAWDREMASLVDAMEATSLILNDDIDTAEVRLRASTATSSFHMLGLGVATFMRSILGFEKDAIAEALKRLTDCETQAAADQKKAQREPAGKEVQIYEPGTEYALVHAEAQMLQAVLAVLHESLTDAVRGFYKLRKAFVTLDGIMKQDDAIMRQHGRLPLAVAGGSRPMSFADDQMPGTFDRTEFADLETDADTSRGAVPADAPSLRPASSKSSIVLEKVATPAEEVTAAVPKTAPVAVTAAATAAATASTPSLASPSSAKSEVLAPDAEFLTNQVDVFVHSGASMCFGIMLLIISMVPPAFSRLLSIVGFKGDGDRGLRMLWNSTQFSNINGGMAGLVLLAYYNGLVGTSDIVPCNDDIALLAGPDAIVGYPKARLEALLAHMCTLYPDSALWKLEEARMLEANRRPREAAALLQKTPVGRIKQVTALIKFQLGLEAMGTLDWPLMRDSFLKCIELNDWSHALYYYTAGCAELELYRMAFHEAASLPHGSNEQRTATVRAEKHRASAETLLRKAPPAAGKKKFMSRQMPFDMLVLRKVARWEERAKAQGVTLADAIIGSPVQEMNYFWVGAKRMSADLLEAALTCLEPARCRTARADQPTTTSAVDDTLDETAADCLVRASLLRALGRLDEARTVLEKEVLVHDRSLFKGATKMDYVLPSAHYESAVICWEEACDPGKHAPSIDIDDAGAVEAFRRKKTDACQTHLETAAKWEAYVLDARIGRRVQTGLDTVQWLKKKKSWV